MIMHVSSEIVQWLRSWSLSRRTLLPRVGHSDPTDLICQLCELLHCVLLRPPVTSEVSAGVCINQWCLFFPEDGSSLPLYCATVSHQKVVSTGEVASRV